MYVGQEINENLAIIVEIFRKNKLSVNNISANYDLIHSILVGIRRISGLNRE